MDDEKNLSPSDIKYSIWDTRTDENQIKKIEKAVRALERSKQEKRK